jgi:hypothetical protein
MRRIISTYFLAHVIAIHNAEIGRRTRAAVLDTFAANTCLAGSANITA